MKIFAFEKPTHLVWSLMALLAGVTWEAQAASGTWNVDAGGNWNTGGNWSAATVPGTAAGDTVGLSFDITGNRIITNDTAVTLGILNIGDANYSNTYTLTNNAGSTLTFNNNGSGAQLNQIATSKGDTISAPLTLNDALTIANNSTNALVLAGVISETGGSRAVIISNSTSAAAIQLLAANTFSGGLTVANGILKVGVSSTTSGTSVTGGAVGTGNLTLKDGTTLACIDSNGRSVAAPVINIAGNITLSQTAVGTGRLSIDGTWNLGGASRLVTLGKASTSWASGSEVFRFEQLTGFSVPTVTNGSLTLTTTNGSAVLPSIARVINTTSFTNNTPLVLDDGVAMSSGTSSFFITGLGAPALTLNAPVTRGGGVLQMGDGVTGTTSNAVMRSAEIYSLSGGGIVSATNFSSATNTLSPAAGTLTINNGNGAVFSGVLNDNPALGKINLTKSGAGTQTLTGGNAYNGTTTISGGTLFVNGTNTVANGTAGYYVINSGGQLGGSGLIDLSAVNLGVTNKSGGKLSPGAASNTIGTLTFKLGTGTLDISGTGTGGLVFDLAGTNTSDKIVLSSGTLNLGAGVLGWTNFAFNLAGNWQAGTYTLIQTPNTIAGTLGANVIGTNAGFRGTIAIAGNNLVVTMTPVSWTGNVSTDFENNGNWGSGAAPVNDLATETATFAGSLTPNLPALTTSRSIGGLAFPTTTGGWTLSGPASDVLSLGANGISSVGQTSGTNIISATLNVATNQTWKAGTGGTLVFTGSITNAQNATTNYSLTINAGGSTGTVIISPAAGNAVNLTGTNGSALLQLTSWAAMAPMRRSPPA